MAKQGSKKRVAFEIDVERLMVLAEVADSVVSPDWSKRQSKRQQRDLEQQPAATLDTACHPCSPVPPSYPWLSAAVPDSTRRFHHQPDGQLEEGCLPLDQPARLWSKVLQQGGYQQAHKRQHASKHDAHAAASLPQTASQSSLQRSRSTSADHRSPSSSSGSDIACTQALLPCLANDIQSRHMPQRSQQQQVAWQPSMHRQQQQVATQAGMQKQQQQATPHMVSHHHQQQVASHPASHQKQQVAPYSVRHRQQQQLAPTHFMHQQQQVVPTTFMHQQQQVVPHLALHRQQQQQVAPHPVMRQQQQQVASFPVMRQQPAGAAAALESLQASTGRILAQNQAVLRQLFQAATKANRQPGATPDAARHFKALMQQLQVLKQLHQQQASAAGRDTPPSAALLHRASSYQQDWLLSAAAKPALQPLPSLDSCDSCKSETAHCDLPAQRVLPSGAAAGAATSCVSSLSLKPQLQRVSSQASVELSEASCPLLCAESPGCTPVAPSRMARGLRLRSPDQAEVNKDFQRHQESCLAASRNGCLGVAAGAPLVLGSPTERLQKWAKSWDQHAEWWRSAATGAASSTLPGYKA